MASVDTTARRATVGLLVGCLMLAVGCGEPGPPPKGAPAQAPSPEVNLGDEAPKTPTDSTAPGGASDDGSKPPSGDTPRAD